MSTMPLRHSVVVPTRNRPGVVRLLESLATQTTTPDEIIVVDQSTSEATHNALRDLNLFADGRLEYVRQAGVTGASRARNEGFARSRGRIVSFIDDDCIAPATWSEETVRLIESGEVDALYGGVLPFEEDQGLTWTPAYDAPRPGILEPGRAPDIYDFGLTANFSATRQTLERFSGPFDPHLGPGGGLHGEDTVMGFRLFRAGLRVLRTREPHVIHLGTRSGSDDIRSLRRMYERGTGNVYAVMYRLGNRRALWHLSAAVWKELRHALVSTFTTGRPSGVASAWHLAEGALISFRRYSIDRETGLLVPRR